MRGYYLIAPALILIISYGAFSANIELEKSKAVVVIDDSNNIWWGKYISSDGEKVKVKLNPANKNISYVGFDTFISTVPRDKVFPCVAAQSKMHFVAYSVPGTHRPCLTCANGIITNSSGSFYFPKQYSLEVDEIDGIRKGSKIMAELKNGISKVRVKHVFDDGYIYFYGRHKNSYGQDICGYGWVKKDKVKLIYKRPKFNTTKVNKEDEESLMVSLIESKSTIQ